jgi:hypothetical protein
MFAPKVAKPQTNAAERPTSKPAPRHSTLAARPFGGGPVEQAHMLQRSIGNQAMLPRLSQRTSSLTANESHGDHEREMNPEGTMAREVPRGISWDFSEIPVFPLDRANRTDASSSVAEPQLPGIIQPKLAIGRVDDPLEHEADRVADQVTRMPPLDLSADATSLERYPCGAAGDGHELAPTLSAKAADAPQAGASGASGIIDSVLRSPGQPLDPGTRRFFEHHFSRDFSHVRIHTDAAAAASADAVRSLAYTVGPHVVFAAGRHAPHDDAGKRLLAHELAHTVQQGAVGRNGAAPDLLQRQAPAPAPQPAPAPASTPASGLSPLVQKFIRGEATDADKAVLRQQLVSGKLSPADVDALKGFLDDQFRSGLRKALPALAGTGQAPTQQAPTQQAGSGGPTVTVQAGGGQLTITPGNDSADVRKFFKAHLRLHLSGAAKALASGLEGTLETTVEVNAGKDAQTATVTIAPPQGNTALAALIRAKAFPNGPIVIPVGAGVVKALRIMNLQGTITVMLTGDKSASGGLVIVTPDLPADVTLDLSISQSIGLPTTAPATGASVLPPPRAFLSAGGGSAGGNAAGATTLGFDLPLVTDTATPVIYGGVGLRASADTSGSLTGTGALIVGAHLSPITLQMALEAGVGRTGADGKTTAALGAEGSIGYKVLQHVEIMTLASVIGGTTTVQAGVGVTF